MDVPPRIFGVNLFSRSFLKWIGCYIKYFLQCKKSFESTELLLEDHFKRWSDSNHPSKAGFLKAISHLTPPYYIVETGTSAWGCDSSRLFDALIRNFGGQFVSVDIRPEASQWLMHQTEPSTSLIVADSIRFLSDQLVNLKISQFNLCYLDSLDFDWEDILLSAKHHLSEYHAVLPFLGRGSVVIVDDQPFSLDEIPEKHRKQSLEFEKKWGYLPGKATLILKEIETSKDIEVLWRGRSLIFQFRI
jgi:hypothetical protein